MMAVVISSSGTDVSGDDNEWKQHNSDDDDTGNSGSGGDLGTTEVMLLRWIDSAVVAVEVVMRVSGGGTNIKRDHSSNDEWQR